MAGVEAALEVANGLSQLAKLAADTAQNMTERWYQASKDFDDFKDLQTKLEHKIHNWTEALRNAGMSDERSITEPLSDAVMCLDDEKKKIDRIQNSCCWSFMYRAQPFPALLKDSMRKVVDAFDNIPLAIGERSEPSRILETLADSRPDSYQIIDVDRRIVKLADTQDEVMRHLNDTHGNQVVTLYGGAGSGKTSLAKSVVKYYQENKTTFVDGARFLSCGHNATVDSICKELFQTLGMDVNAESAPDVKTEQPFKSKGAPSGVPSEDNLKKLRRRLKERHLLIVLDDVSDYELLKEKLIVPHARAVKYLITSQKREIYDGATVVHMEPPSLEEAMKILGNYVPNLSNGDIPSHLQDVATQIILKSEKHPMTLTTIGRQIDDNSSWDDVLDDFNGLLSSERTDKLGTSMLMAVDALGCNSNAQKLLYLMAMCEPLNIPEVLLQLFFQHIDTKHIDSKYIDSKCLLAFKKHGKSLKDRDLIVVKGKDWVLSSTYQHFILEKKQEDVSELLCCLMKDNCDHSDNLLVKALCILLIVPEEGTFTPEAVSILENATPEFKTLKNQIMLLNMRDAIIPLIYLLFPSKEGNECEKRRHRLVSKVIQQFVFKQDLDDESFSQLLQEHDIYEDICYILVRMTKVKATEPILTKDTIFILEELRFNLSPKSEKIVTTLETLSGLSDATNCDFILDDDSILKNLLEILRSENQDEKQSTLICLSTLAQSPTAREKIDSCEGLIEALVAIFTESDDMAKQVGSIQALGNIGLHEMTSTKLVKIPYLLTNIAQFLEHIYSDYFKEEDFILETGHRCAYSTIYCLVSWLKGNKDNEGDISKHEKLMHVLISIFEKYNGDQTYSNNNPESFYTGDRVAQVAIRVLTLIDPRKYNNVRLYSDDAYIARGDSNAYRGLYKEAFKDYKWADSLDNFNDLFYKMTLCFLKAMLKDYKGALVYANRAIEADPNNQIVWQERGVLKELMGDYSGAKNDLNKSLLISPNDYETLKHRAYVNFNLACEKEAHEDAQKALQIIPKYRVDSPEYEQADCLGVLSVPKFLDYDLK